MLCSARVQKIFGRIADTGGTNVRSVGGEVSTRAKGSPRYPTASIEDCEVFNPPTKVRLADQDKGARDEIEEHASKIRQEKVSKRDKGNE
jgi:hypothetical protein